MLEYDFNLEVKLIPVPDMVDLVNTAPSFADRPSNKKVYFLEPLVYNLGKPLDHENDNIEVTY